jgi:hypothetical protein
MLPEVDGSGYALLSTAFLGRAITLNLSRVRRDGLTLAVEQIEAMQLDEDIVAATASVTVRNKTRAIA